MNRCWVVGGGVLGALRRGLRGALFGAAVGWTLGWLLTPARRRTLPEADHYARYPEEEFVDALCEHGDEADTAAAAMDDLSRDLPGRG